MSNIDLSKYVGKKVNVTLRCGSLRSGEIAPNLDAYPFVIVCDDGTGTYKANGMWRTNKQTEYDIVKIEELHDTSMISVQDAIKTLESLGYEIKKPFILDFDWSCLPKWANKCISMNVNGDWCSWGGSPQKDNYTRIWVHTDFCYKSTIPTDFAPKNFVGSWKDSLFKNPNIKD